MKTHSARSIMVATAVLLFAPAAWALDRAPVLNLDVAKKMADACEAKARDMKWKMNVSVVDSGANQIVFERMDGAFLGSGDIALHKAQTSAKFPFPTRLVEQLAYGKDLKGGALPGLPHVPGIIAFAGGLPIMTADGVQVGAVGVSGGTADEDEQCAQAAIDAVKDLLK